MQIAASFVILVTPAAVGGVALNVRYLRKAKLSAADAAASVGVTQVMSFAVFGVLVLVSAAIAGSSKAAKALTPPHWAYIALGVLVGLALIVLALPAGRRLLLSRVGSVASQVIPRLVDVAQRPVKLVQGIGGTLLITLAYILCLAASVRAVGDANVPLASIAVVYLAGNAAGSFIPTPAASARSRRLCPSRWPAPACSQPRRSRPCCCSGPSRSGCRSWPAGSPCTTCSARTPLAARRSARRSHWQSQSWSRLSR